MVHLEIASQLHRFVGF